MTAFSDVINAFYHYIEKDVDFFQYFELDEEECMEVAGQRAGVLLEEATSYLCRKLIIENVFSHTELVHSEEWKDRYGTDEQNEDEQSEGGQSEDRQNEEDSDAYMAFTETLANTEINLLVKAMFLMYLQRDLTVLRTFHGVMTSSDLNMYSPANERKTFVAMVQQYETDLKVEISEYQMFDRKTGGFIQICE